MLKFILVLNRAGWLKTQALSKPGIVVIKAPFCFEFQGK